VVVRREERERLHIVVQVLGDGPGEAHPVVGRGAASYLVQDDQLLALLGEPEPYVVV
jgi:hypothetical protein